MRIRPVICRIAGRAAAFLHIRLTGLSVTVLALGRAGLRGILAVSAKQNKKLWKAAAGGVAACILAAGLLLTALLFGTGEQVLSKGMSLDETVERKAVSTTPQKHAVMEPVGITSRLGAEALPIGIYAGISPVTVAASEESAGFVPGARDPRIAGVQERLMELGYMPKNEPTDDYGNLMEDALQLFQRNHSLDTDGLLSDETLRRLYSDDAEPYAVRIGDKGADVQNLQERLKELDYLDMRSSGYFEEATEDAVKNFQIENGLAPSGLVDEHTSDRLHAENARPARPYSSSVSSSGSSGGSSSGVSVGGSSSGENSGGDGAMATGDPDKASVGKLLEIARSLLGKKYVRGGKGPKTFDCSGFVYYCLKKAGYSVKYMTSSGWAKCSFPKVAKMKDMKKGDIICFKKHVAIYMGNGKMIDASASNGKVVTRMGILGSSYWTKNFICARRLF